MSQRILLKGGTVVSMASDENADGRTADILIEGSRIADVAADICCDDAEFIDATDTLVLPGFVDTHRHTWQTVFRGIASDWSLAQYATGMHGTLKPHFRPSDIHIANQLGRIEALNSGITTMLDWSHGILSPAHADAAAQGLADAPGRSIFGYSGSFGFPCDDAIADELTRLRHGVFSSDSSLVTLALGLRGPQYSSLETTRADVTLARQLGLRITVHGGSAGWGRNRPIGRMFELGLLDDRTTVVHCNTLADDEIHMMADCGCTASVSPDAEIQMGFGWPATGRLLDAGILPSLSIDDCAAVGGDMFRTMHALLVAQRGLDNQSRADAPDQTGLRLRCRDVLGFATLEGARACGMDDRIGSIEVGKEADLLMIRADDLSVFPMNNPLGTLVTAGHAGLVDAVFVAGRMVKRGGRLVDVDVDRLRQRALASRQEILERANASRGRNDRIDLGGHWQPSVEGFTASAVSRRRQ